MKMNFSEMPWLASISARQILGFVAVVSFTAVCIALLTQFALDMQPCSWCILQRLICIAIVLGAFPGVIWPRRIMLTSCSVLVIFLALAGAAAALGQHFAAAVSASCNYTLAERVVDWFGLAQALPFLFESTASCADAAARLFGIPYEFWTLTLFAVLAMLTTIAFFKRPSS